MLEVFAFFLRYLDNYGGNTLKTRENNSQKNREKSIYILLLRKLAVQQKIKQSGTSFLFPLSSAQTQCDSVGGNRFTLISPPRKQLFAEKLSVANPHTRRLQQQEVRVFLL